MSTTKYSVTNAAWVNVGSGPALVENLYDGRVFLIQAVAQPAAGDTGHIVAGYGKPGSAVEFRSTGTIWARSEKIDALVCVSDASINLGSSEAHLGEVGGKTAKLVASFTRPADTTAYASGDLVANNTVAGSVAPMQFSASRSAGKGGMIRRTRIRKTGTGLTNASFRVHLYASLPTPSNGDNGVWLTDKAVDYIGALDVTVDRAFTDGAAGNGVPKDGSEINFVADTLYGLVEARGAYVPANGETFTIDLEVLQN